MKKLLSLAVMAIGLAEAQAQDVKIEFITPSIVHVVKGQPTKTLVVTAKPQDVAVTKKGNTTSSKELTVKQERCCSRRRSVTCLRHVRPSPSTRTRPSTDWAPSRTAR